MTSRATALILASLLTPAALAQPFCGFEHSVRLAQLVGDNSSSSYLEYGPVTSTTAPFISTVGLNPSTPCGCSSSTAFTIAADYGSLAFVGTASGQSCPCAGISLSIDDFNNSGGPRTRFFDRITVASATLPAGTPVQLRVTLQFDGGITWQNEFSARTFGAFVSLDGDRLALDNQIGAPTRDYPATVGQTIGLNAGINCVLQDYALGNFNRTGGFTANLRAIVRIEPLSPGVVLTSCSGHNYAAPICDSIDFNNNGVFPEDQDVIDFFSVLAGAPCVTCSDIDFNNNGVFPEDQDVIDFFTVLAGGECGA